MRCSEMIHHLTQLRTLLGDVEVLIDADVWRDTLPLPATSAAHLLLPVQAFVEGVFVHDKQTSKVVIYVGNEPKAVIQ